MTLFEIMFILRSHNDIWSAINSTCEIISIDQTKEETLILIAVVNIQTPKMSDRQNFNKHKSVGITNAMKYSHFERWCYTTPW